MDFFLHATRRMRAAATIVLLSCTAATHAAPMLEVSAFGFLYDRGVGVVGPSVGEQAPTGPLDTRVEAGMVLTYPSGHGAFNVEATAFAAAKARADYGSNGVFVSLGLRPASGTDRGIYPAGVYTGFPVNSTLGPSAGARSQWTDSFVIEGGTGVGRASVNIDVSGRAYRDVGTGMPNEWAFDSFNTRGWGIAKYQLDIDYSRLPPGLDPEYSRPISWEQQWSTGQRVFNTDNLPDHALVLGQRPALVGSFDFEYGVAFELDSSLSVWGYDMVTVDFLHTFTLSHFMLPEGASLTSGSGHLYATAAVDPGNQVPTPATLWLLAPALLAMGAMGVSRRARSPREVDVALGHKGAQARAIEPQLRPLYAAAA